LESVQNFKAEINKLSASSRSQFVKSMIGGDKLELYSNRQSNTHHFRFKFGIGDRLLYLRCVKIYNIIE